MIATLTSHIESMDFSQQLSEVNNLMGRAEATTTFWGSRVVKVDGFIGSVYLDEIAHKVLDVARRVHREKNAASVD